MSHSEPLVLKRTSEARKNDKKVTKEYFNCLNESREGYIDKEEIVI